MIKGLYRQLLILPEIRLLWIGLYLLKLAMALVIIAPFFLGANANLAVSDFARSLISSWDVTVLVELFGTNTNLMSYLVLSILVGLTIYLVIMQFLNGGIYYLMVSRKFTRIDGTEFFAECGRSFRYNIYITVMMIPILFIMLISANVFVNIISLASNDLIGSPAVFMMLIKFGIILLILLMTSVFADAARAAATAYPEKSFREVLKIAADYFRPRFLRMTLAFILTFVPFFILWLLVERTSLIAVGAFGGFIGITVEFLLFQLSSFVRTGQKLWYLTYLGQDFRSRYQGRFIPEQVELGLD